jgi:hypothetical protein
LSDAIFSSFAKNGFCLSQVSALSGYGIFRLERFLVMAFSGSAKKQGYCIAVMPSSVTPFSVRIAIRFGVRFYAKGLSQFNFRSILGEMYRQTIVKGV